MPNRYSKLDTTRQQSKSKERQVQAAEFELLKLSNKVRFILAVIAGDLKINNRKKADIVADLDAAGYDRIAPAKRVRPFLFTTELQFWQWLK